MPKSRKEFEHNMFLLNEAFLNNTIKINISNRFTIKGIENTKMGPNRRCNLHTVNEASRLMANSVANMMQYNEFKPENDGEE